MTHITHPELLVSSMLEIYTSGLDKVSDAMFLMLHCCNKDRLVAMVVLTNSHRGFLQCILVKYATPRDPPYAQIKFSLSFSLKKVKAL